jgi:ABC-type dipeptide/oligopeptide/nickel transport system ATPase component
VPVNTNLLSIQDLTVIYQAEKEVSILNNVSLEIPHASIVALVGGSGSGKTTTAMAVLRLLPQGFEIKKGSMLFKGEDIAQLSHEKMRSIRGKHISMIFQEPLYAFNPVYTINYQINEVLECHTELSLTQRKTRVLELLRIVGIKDPQRIADSYPHQLSGGLRQRAMIAQAIAADPKLLIADEPTSNLDVTLQARIIELFKTLKRELSLSILLITHDLGVVAHLADYTAVMTQGKIVEAAPTSMMISQPKHAYTNQLMKASLF